MIEITVRPESLPHSHHFTVEWEYIEYDREAMEWKPLRNGGQKDDAM